MRMGPAKTYVECFKVSREAWGLEAHCGELLPEDAGKSIAQPGIGEIGGKGKHSFILQLLKGGCNESKQ
jgi:hypothetical protein